MAPDGGGSYVQEQASSWAGELFLSLWRVSEGMCIQPLP